MTTASYQYPSIRPVRRETASHLFSVGQTVRLKTGFATARPPSSIFHITATLPPKMNSPQYRIRNDDERHERVATQDDLEPVDASRPGGEAATLMERTFGHGQGTETQQPRDQEAEAGEGRAQG
ncbi:MAG: hypothetical protein F9K19_22305 [Rhizobiaceae bacterium]|nr:MAG: hypothetical protein F9K19_22305 [Rhizobiaceae bacterium]